MVLCAGLITDAPEQAKSGVGPYNLIDRLSSWAKRRITAVSWGSRFANHCSDPSLRSGWQSEFLHAFAHLRTASIGNSLFRIHNSQFV